MLAALIWSGASCATVYAPALVPGQIAQVKIVGPPDTRLAADGYRPQRTVDVRVHDYANGCPLVEDKRTGKGFRGKIEAPFAATTTVSVPTGRRLTFTSVRYVGEPWPGRRMSVGDFCTSVISFVPQPGRTYVIRFPEVADGRKRACGTTAELVGAAPPARERSEIIAYPHALRGADAFQSGGLCALGGN